MKRNHLVVVLAHPKYGRLQRLHIPHYVLHAGVFVTLFAGILAIGFVSSYGRMLGKVSEFNDLRAEKASLEKQYMELQQQAAENETRLAALGSLASEVSIAYGIRRDAGDEAAFLGGPALTANYDQSVNQFDFLQNVRLRSQGDSAMLSMLSNTTPSIWPLKGRISSSFGKRVDPFKGTGSFHPGVDLSARKGTPVVATADGTVRDAGWSGGYGKRVVINHGGNSFTTLYGHLTEVFAVPGQVVRRGEVIGRAGSTGRATSSHLHYEVRLRGVVVNPYKYLQKAQTGNTALIAD